MTDTPRPLMPEELVPLFMDGDTFVPDMWWWGFDTFLVKLVETVAAKFLKEGHGYPCQHIIPGDAVCNCEQEWREYLEGIRDDLAGYDKFASTATVQQQQQVQDALRRFIDRLGNWWD